MARRSGKNRGAGDDTEDLTGPEDDQHAVTLTPEELADRRNRLTQICLDLETTEESYTNVKSKFNKKLKGLRGEMARLVKTIRTGEEMQQHPELPMGG